MQKASAVTILLAIILLASISFGAPTEITYQGHLTDADGRAVDSFFDITFRLYADPAGTDILWEEVHGVQVSGGSFSVILGSSTPMDLTTFPVRADSLWLEIQVGSDAPISPRTKINSVPIAAVAASVQGDVSTDNGRIVMLNAKGDTTIILDAQAARGVITELHPPGNGTGHEVSQGITDTSSFVEMSSFDVVDSSHTIVSATESRSQLKTYFETGDVPTEAGIFSTSDTSGMQLRNTTGSWDTEIVSLALNGSASIAANSGNGIDDDCDGVIEADESGARMSLGANFAGAGVSIINSVNKLDHHGHITVLKIANGGLDTTNMVSLFGDPDFASVEVGDGNSPGGFVVTNAVNTVDHHGHITVLKIANGGLDTTTSIGLFGDPDFARIEVNDSAFSVFSDADGTSLYMNKAELIDALASTIEDRTGRASISRRAARTGRNPQTGATIQITSKTSLNDTTGGSFSMRYLDEDSDDDGLLDMAVNGDGASMGLSKADAGKALNAFVTATSLGLTIIDSTLNDSALIDMRIDNGSPILLMAEDKGTGDGSTERYEFTLLPDRIEIARAIREGGRTVGAGQITTISPERFSMVDSLGDTSLVIRGGGGGAGGSIRVKTSNTGTGIPPSSVEIADLNRDGRMDVAIGGELRLGGASSGNILAVAQGSLTDPIADSWTIYSSRRWKENINTIDDALEKILKLRGVEYDWKESGKHDIGLIAEEVGEVIPEIVTYEENGIDAKSVDYSRLVSLLIEASKEQQSKIESMQAEIAELKALVTKLANQSKTNTKSNYGMK